MNEFELIYQIFSKQFNEQLHAADNIVKGIGDDSAVLQCTNNSQMVLCTDTLVQGRHFTGDWQHIAQMGYEIGYKAVAVNLSDIAAMGAVPHNILLAIALPKKLAQQTWLSKFAQGLFDACQPHNVCLIGGDTTQSEQLVITITAQGMVEKQQGAIYRSGAKVGDKVYVSGSLGDASFALQYPDVNSKLTKRLHLPTARVNLGCQLNSTSTAITATSMIDVSDGLYQDLNHICQQSQVSVKLNLDTLPTSNELANVPFLSLSERLLLQLTGGDDYELIFTLPNNSLLPSVDVPITCIGEVISTKTNMAHATHLFYQNKPVTATHSSPFACFPNLAGYQHF